MHYEHSGELIKKHRQLLEWSKPQLAHKMRYSPSWVEKIESGKLHLSPATMEMCIAALDLEAHAASDAQLLRQMVDEERRERKEAARQSKDGPLSASEATPSAPDVSKSADHVVMPPLWNDDLPHHDLLRAPRMRYGLNFAAHDQPLELPTVDTGRERRLLASSRSSQIAVTFVVLLVLIMFSSMALPTSDPPLSPQETAAQAYVRLHWVIAVMPLRDAQIIAVADPHSDTAYPLWPGATAGQQARLSSLYIAYLSPIYNTATDELAFIGLRRDGSRVVLMAQLILDALGHLALAGWPIVVMTLCAACADQINWTATGDGIFFERPDGLALMSLATHQIQLVAPDSASGGLTANPHS